MQKIFRLLLVAVVLLIGVVWFAHWSKTRGHKGASIAATRPPASGGSQTNPPDANAANPVPSPDQTAQAHGEIPPQEVASATAAEPPANPMVPQHAGPITEQPAANALSPHPPAGFVTPASQKFALYRQGDLTYRLNTQSGQACVLLASEDLWRKPLVYQHGCAGH